MASLTTSTQFLKNVTKETSALFQESFKNGCDIPTVELREASLDETDLVHFIEYIGDQFPIFIYNEDQDVDHSTQNGWIKTNAYYLLTKELSKSHTDPIDKTELLLRACEKFEDIDKKSEEIREKQQKLKQILQDISKLERDLAHITETDGKSLIGSDIALLKEEAELDRLELQISKLKSNNIH